MNLNQKVEKLKQIKSEIKDLYHVKEEVERCIIELIGNGETETDDLLTVSEVFEERLDFEKLKAKYPNVYQWGMVPKFDYKTAMLSFDDKKTFFKIIEDCKTKYKRKKIQVKRRNRYGNWTD